MKQDSGQPGLLTKILSQKRRERIAEWCEMMSSAMFRRITVSRFTEAAGRPT